MSFKRRLPGSLSPTAHEALPLAASYDHSGQLGSWAAILQAAAGQVVRQWGQHTGEAHSSHEISDLMVVLAASVLETQVTAAPVIDRRMRSGVGRRLVDQLRKEVVTRWAQSGVPAADMAPLLLALERVREAIDPWTDEGFEAQLTGAGGMELLVDVAHDLRSPLTSILFVAETMQRGESGPVTDVQRRQLGLIYAAALGLSSVVSDIMDLSRSDRLVEPAPIPFWVAGVLKAVQDIVRPVVEEKRLVLRILRPANDLRMGHPVALSRVLLNLTTNALKFTDKGYVEILTRELLTHKIEFAVRDSGRGIDPAILATLFSPTRPANGRPQGARLFSQTGLGLTICRKLVRAMGSELRVESRPGWGTRFFFELDLPLYAPPQHMPRGGASAFATPSTGTETPAADHPPAGSGGAARPRR